MDRRTFMRGVSMLAIGLTGAGLTGCDVAVVRPAYGRLDYYYYPDVNVYFHVWTGFYYYFTDGVWVRATVLPAYILLNPAYRRILVIDDPVPYQRNAEHRLRYGVPSPSRPGPAPRPGFPARPSTAPAMPGGAPTRQQRQIDAEERARLEETKRRKHRAQN